MEIIESQLLTTGGIAALIGVVLMILRYYELFHISFGKKDDKESRIDMLENHASVANSEMGEMNKKFDKMLEMQDQENLQHQEMLFILRDIKDKIK
jgi:hypothetical protein